MNILFQMNLCGTVSDCPPVYGNQVPSVCEVFSNGTKIGLTAAGSDLDFSTDTGMTLSMYGNRLGNGKHILASFSFMAVTYFSQITRGYFCET